MQLLASETAKARIQRGGETKDGHDMSKARVLRENKCEGRTTAGTGSDLTS